VAGIMATPSKRHSSGAASAMDSDISSSERFAEAKAVLMPIVRHLRASNGSKDVDAPEISKRDLQQLAIAWKLTATNPNFWAQHPTVEHLARVLAKTAKRMRETGTWAPHLEGLQAAAVKKKDR